MCATEHTIHANPPSANTHERGTPLHRKNVIMLMMPSTEPVAHRPGGPQPALKQVMNGFLLFR